MSGKLPLETLTALLVQCCFARYLLANVFPSQHIKKKKKGTRKRVHVHTFRVHTSRLIISFALKLLQQSPKPLRILRVLQSHNIWFVLEVVQAVQLSTSRAATQNLRRGRLRWLRRVRICMHALRCAQRLGNARGSRGHGGGYCDVVRNGLSGGRRRRRSGNRGFSITVIPGLGSLQQGLACGR